MILVAIVLFSFFQMMHSSIIDKNERQQQQPKPIHELQPVGDRMRHIIVFSLSFKVLHEEMRKWDWDTVSDLKTICQYSMLTHTLPIFNDGKWMLFFGDELVRVQRNESYSDVWMSADEILSECTDRLTIDNYMVQDIGADAYEPSREFNTKFLKKVEHELKNYSYSADENLILHLITNFAERALAKYLMNANANHEYHNFLALQNMQSANYNLYALNISENLIIFPEPYHCYYKYDEDEHHSCDYYSNKETDWPQIYLFAFSKNLTFVQRNSIIESLRRTMIMYISMCEKEPVSVLLASHGNSEYIINPSEFYNKAEPLATQFSETASFLCANGSLLNVDLIEREATYTAALWERSLAVFYAHLWGAQLPPEMEADAIKPVIHPKPRVVLITDYVEEKFANGHLPNRSVFEFKVYALNPIVYGAYEDKADLVIRLNPDEPGEIPIGRNDSEPEPIKRELEKIGHNYYLSLQILVPIIVGSVALFLFIILILYCRLRRMNWLHKLERFKTEHLFHAYQNSQTAKKNSKNREEPWEMRWDQLLLNSEQLGRGVFGAVYKATLTSLPKWMTSSTAEADVRQREFIKSNGIRAGSQVAVKMLRPEQASEKHRLNFLKEIEIMKMLANEGGQHRCVVRMLGCMSRAEGTLGLVLEYCPGGNLVEYVKQVGENKEVQESKETCAKTFRQFARFGWQICDGMLFLGTKNLVHRDLAARNVLLDGELCAKIADFGLCICLNEVKNSPECEEQNMENEAIKPLALDNERLPIRWLAPECLKRRKFSQKSDLWSFGVLLHEMFTFGRNPFEGVDHKDLLEYILQNQQEGYMEKSAFCPDEIYEIMQKCLTFYEEERPNFAQTQEKLAAFLEKNSGANLYDTTSRLIQ